MDDGKAPTLQAFGAASVSIYVGNAQQQVSVAVTLNSRNYHGYEPMLTD
jgi:hypothetical protein